MVEVFQNKDQIQIVARQLHDMSIISSKELNARKVLEYYSYNVDKLVDNIKIDTIQKRINLKF